MSHPIVFEKLAMSLEARGINPYAWADSFEKNAQAAALAKPMADIGNIGSAISGGFKNFLSKGRDVASRVMGAAERGGASASKRVIPPAGPVNYNRQAVARQSMTGAPATSVYGAQSTAGVRPLQERSATTLAPKGLYASPAERQMKAITSTPGGAHLDTPAVTGARPRAKPVSPFRNDPMLEAQGDAFVGLAKTSAHYLLKKIARMYAYA